MHTEKEISLRNNLLTHNNRGFNYKSQQNSTPKWICYNHTTTAHMKTEFSHRRFTYLSEKFWEIFWKKDLQMFKLLYLF